MEEMLGQNAAGVRVCEATMGYLSVASGYATLPWNPEVGNREALHVTVDYAWQGGCCLATNTAKCFIHREILKLVM